MKKNKSRLIYFIIFILLFAIEVLIALFVHDNFVRPFIGDVVVVMLVCAFAFSILASKIDNVILSTALGRTFDIKDIICYTIGGVMFFVAELLLRRKTDEP